jgi:Reverse transcriptase (RNA-dependent DNA polymerase)
VTKCIFMLAPATDFDTKIFTFADDSNLFIHGKTKTEIKATAAQCLSSLSDWFLANKLSLSLDKTCFTVFPASKTEDITILLGTNTVKRVHSSKYLGVIIDAELKWTEHIN